MMLFTFIWYVFRTDRAVSWPAIKIIIKYKFFSGLPQSSWLVYRYFKNSPVLQIWIKWVLIRQRNFSNLVPDPAEIFPNLVPDPAEIFPNSDPDLAESFPNSDPDLAESFPNSYPDLAESFPNSGPDLAQSFPNSGPDLAESFINSRS